MLGSLQGFLSPGTDVTPIVPALEKIWADSMVQSMANFNFRLVTSKFNDLVYEYPIRIPERYALVIRRATSTTPQTGGRCQKRRSAAGSIGSEGPFLPLSAGRHLKGLAMLLSPVQCTMLRFPLFHAVAACAA